jgi:threonine aldolase
MKPKIFLASDNWAPAHPLVLKAICEANNNNAPAYGGDEWTKDALSLIQEQFRTQASILMVPTGTGANICALSLSCRRFESVICTDIAHINAQESGAAEAMAGTKLLTVPHENGKIKPEAIIKKLTAERALAKHGTLPKVVSIAQTTEYGTVYNLKELQAIADLCHRENLLLHMDGSRLYNAAIFLNTSLHEITKTANVDILSLGGTKNGLLAAEALIIFNKDLAAGAEHIHKQHLQLLSKMRYLSAQFIPFFKNKLWHDLAKHANEKAQEVAAIINNIPQLKINYPVESNQIFFSAPPMWRDIIQEHIHCMTWNKEHHELRLITSWYSSDEDIRALKDFFEGLIRDNKEPTINKNS